MSSFNHLNKKNNPTMVNVSDKKIIKAFQRRFLPSKVSGKIDQKTLDISHFLAKKF